MRQHQEPPPPPPPPSLVRLPPQPPPPPPGGNRPVKKTSCGKIALGCLGLLVFSLFAVVAIIRCAVHGTPFPNHGAVFSQTPPAPEINPALPRVTNGDTLRAAITGFVGERFTAYTAIDGLGSNVRLEIEMPDPADPAITEEQIDVFDQMRTDYAGMKPQVLAQLLESYAAMRADMLSHQPQENRTRANVMLWIFGFPSYDTMFQPIETSSDMERLWGHPDLEISARKHRGKLVVVIQDIPAWNSEDTFGGVLQEGEILYAGMDPDRWWYDRAGERPSPESGTDSQTARNPSTE